MSYKKTSLYSRFPIFEHFGLPFLKSLEFEILSFISIFFDESVCLVSYSKRNVKYGVIAHLDVFGDIVCVASFLKELPTITITTAVCSLSVTESDEYIRRVVAEADRCKK